MPPGDIQSRLRFDTRQFNTGTASAEKRLESLGEAGIRIFERLTQVAQGFQSAVAGLKLPDIKPNVTVNFKDSGVTAFRTELDGAYVSTTALTGATEQLGNTAQRAIPKLEGAGAGAGRLGDSSDRATPQVERLQNAVDRLQQVGALLASGAGLVAYFRRVETSANSAQQAIVGQTLFNRELAKQNIAADEGEQALGRLGDRFKINTALIKEDAAGILRYGANLTQTEEILLRTGASAVIRGRKFKDGSNAANEALNGEYSAALNLIGVSGNLSTYFQRMAKELDTTTDKLTKQQKVEAFLRLLRAETGTEVESLTDIYIGYGAAQQRVSDQQMTAAQNTGNVVIPALTVLKNLYADLLELYNNLPRPLQALVVGTVTLGVVVGALTVAYISLRALLLNQRTLGPVILDLLRNETVARGRLGGVILAQSQAYGLLSKSQLASAQASVAAARANAASAAGAGRLGAVLRTPIQGGMLLSIGALVVIAREAVNYLGVLRPVVEGVTRAFLGMGLDQVVQGFNDVTAGGQLFVAVFKNAVLYTVTAVSLAIEELSFQQTRALLVAQKWRQQVMFDGEGAARTQAAIDALKTSHENSKNAILDSAAAYETQNTNAYLAASGLEGYASSTELAADGTRKLTEEAQTLVDTFKGRLDELEPEIDTSTMSGQITAATKELDGLIADLKAEIEKLPIGDILRKKLGELLTAAQEQRKTQVGAVYAAALVEAEQEAADSTLGAMRDGATKIEAQRTRDLAAAEKAFKERTALLSDQSERYKEFQTLYNAQVAGINAAADESLRADAEGKLETARGLAEQIDQVARDLASKQAEGSGDALTSIRVQYAQNAQQIRADTQKLLNDVAKARREGAINDAEAATETVRINTLMAAQLTQNQADLTRETEAELERRRNVVQDHYSAIATLEANHEAQRQRDEGDDVGAVQTELADRLRLIDQGLRRELQQEGLTRAQIVAITRKAEADRVQARQDAGREIEGIMRDEVSRERTFQNELRSIQQQDTIDAAQSAGLNRSAAVAEYERSVSDLEAAQQEELSAVNLSEEKKQQIYQASAAKRRALDAGYNRQLTQLTEDEAGIVAASAQEGERARAEALEGSLPRLTRQFQLEQQARLRADEEKLKTFEGTEAERLQIVARNAQREATLARSFSAQYLKEQKSALTAYENAYIEANKNIEAAERELLSVREEAASAALSATQKLTGTGASLTSSNLRQEQLAFDGLRDTLEESVVANGRFVEAARARGQATNASAADVNRLVAAERQQVEAQSRVVDGIQSQIDRLKSLREEQLGIIRGGSDALSLFDSVSKITGLGEVVDITPQLLKQKDALFQLLRQQDALNAPTQERLQTIQQIGDLTDRLGEKNIKLGFMDEAFLNGQALKALNDYPKQAQDALDKSALLAKNISSLQKDLGSAQQTFAGMLEQVSEATQQGFRIQLDDSDIRKDLVDAREALADVFGADAAARISEDFAKGFRVTDLLQTELHSASSSAQNQMAEAGAAAGKGFMTAFGQGISDSGGIIEQKLEEVLRPARQLLPSSDAKRGPLSDLTWSGGKMVTTYAGGVRAKLPDLNRVVMQMASISRPLLGVPSTMRVPGLAGIGGGGGDTNTFNFPDIYSVDDLTRLDMRRAGDSLMRYAKSRARMGYRAPRRGRRS